MVHYNYSLWSKENGLPGLPQKVNWHLEYLGFKRSIPVIYRFPKGIVFDIITILDEAELREFFKKYESIEKTMTSLERRCAEQEHPYQAVSVKEIYIDGKQVEEISSSSSISIPWAKGNDLDIIRKLYPSILKDRTSFACQRFCIPYPETVSKTQRLLCFLRLNKVNSMKISTNSVDWFYPLDIHFKISDKENEKTVCFNHPVNGIEHTIYFQNSELMEIPLGSDGKQTFYAIRMMYEIEPALPQGDRLQFNSSFQYKVKHNNSIKGRFNPEAAASIGIIGGADGPTAVFLSSAGQEKYVPHGLHGLPLYSCVSVPSFEKEDVFDFLIEGINTKKYDGREYNFR